MSAHEILIHLKIPADFEDTSGRLDYIHRATDGEDIYFVRNPSAQSLDSVATFRAAGLHPQLWNPLNGSISDSEFASVGRERTAVSVHLAPFGSTFVVFSKSSKSAMLRPEPKSISANVSDLPASHWTFNFQAERGAPTGSLAITTFASWSESATPEIRYFSGTATYRTTFSVSQKQDQRTLLTLTDLHEICSVRVNGRDAGTIWAIPYELDITRAVRRGQNRLELAVTNLWPNRIIGDAQPDATQRYTHTNIRKYRATSPLLPSGLIGPVSIKTLITGN